jgi:hypothetical protein
MVVQPHLSTNKINNFTYIFQMNVNILKLLANENNQYEINSSEAITYFKIKSYKTFNENLNE